MNIDREGVFFLSAAQLHDFAAHSLAGIADALANRIACGEIQLGIGAIEADALVNLSIETYCLGLSDPLLDFAESFLGDTCYYLGAALKREISDGEIAGVRQWHLDIEDERVLRLLIYLSPVSPADGPFEFISADRSAAAKRDAGYRIGLLDDAAMAALVSPENWIGVYGCIGDAVIFDGAAVFHRAQAPAARDRLSFTLTYVTRHPLELKPSARLSPAAHATVVAALGPRATAALPPHRSKSRQPGQPAKVAGSIAA